MSNDDNNEIPKEAINQKDVENVQEPSLEDNEVSQDSNNVDPEDSVLSDATEESKRLIHRILQKTI
jgi:hypothetical protein